MPHPYFYIIGISTLVSVFYFKKFRNTKNIYFIYFIFFTFFIDKLGYFNRIFQIITIDGYHNNNPILNSYALITFLFFLLFYETLFKKLINKKIMKLFIVIYLIFILIEIFIFKTNFINEFYTKTTVFGSILFLISLILFLIEIIKNDQLIFNIEKSFVFYISIGCLLFYVGVIPIMISSKKLLLSGMFDTILIIMNSIAHGIFVIGYIYSEKKYNY